MLDVVGNMTLTSTSLSISLTQISYDSDGFDLDLRGKIDFSSSGYASVTINSVAVSYDDGVHSASASFSGSITGTAESVSGGVNLLAYSADDAYFAGSGFSLSFSGHDAELLDQDRKEALWKIKGVEGAISKRVTQRR